MWFSRTPTKESLQGYKCVKVNRSKFTIRRINPLLDFASDKIPQIFTSYYNRRGTPEVTEAKKIREFVMSVVEVGLVEPPLSPRGKEGITVDDIFRDEELGNKLYFEIMFHSLLRFRGIKKLFFWIKTKYLLYIIYRKNMARYPLMLYSLMGDTPKWKPNS